jgi:Sugar efflux transporter for intercellular exchange
VIRTRDSSSLYIPAVVANVLNAFMWVVYGFVSLKDPMVYIPNGVGFVLAILQLVLAFTFRQPLKEKPLPLLPVSHSDESSRSNSYEGKLLSTSLPTASSRSSSDIEFTRVVTTEDGDNATSTTNPIHV